ncbi:hypothetical protein CR161_01190 [Prosthecochloris sp. ZM]|uniref:MTH1187 family thiamine-binding protein n=1 Tax=Prosthecochloris sp. ZM TaxID=2283143 RepID=UPI000DF743A6|nr:MTH1187 family thiamine-binding protein [Prosthecochloris sp. ZM]RDD29433.1 hypothetical protein CR161_01190 [Prosthecochloris sp. ZM]
MALVDITIIPLDGRSGGLGAVVAELEALLDKSGLEYRLHDMGTTVCGSADELFDIARRLHEHLFSKGAARVYTVMKLDDRRDREVRLGDKVASVERGRDSLR